MRKRPLWGLRGCRLLPLLLADFYSYIAAQPKAKLAKVFLPLTAASRQSAADYIPATGRLEFLSSLSSKRASDSQTLLTSTIAPDFLYLCTISPLYLHIMMSSIVFLFSLLERSMETYMYVPTYYLLWHGRIQ